MIRSLVAKNIGIPLKSALKREPTRRVQRELDEFTRGSERPATSATALVSDRCHTTCRYPTETCPAGNTRWLFDGRTVRRLNESVLEFRELDREPRLSQNEVPHFRCPRDPQARYPLQIVIQRFGVADRVANTLRPYLIAKVLKERADLR